jgi:molecular chaperone DnaK
MLQKERMMMKDNKTLRMFGLNAIPLASHGIDQIVVTFDIDVKGILDLTVENKGTGKDQKIMIIGGGTSGLSDQKIEKVSEDAEEGKKQKENIEVRDQLNQFIY